MWNCCKKNKVSDLESRPGTKEAFKENERHNEEKKFYQGNWNVWLIAGAIFSLYFIFGLGIPWIIKEIQEASEFPIFSLLHFIGFMVFSIGCIVNIFHTPSHGKIYKQIHVIIGRTVIIIGGIAQISGMVMVWTTHYEKAMKRGLPIGITIGGAVTLIFSALGYIFIKKGMVTAHKLTMILMFFGGGLVPALIRIPRIFDIFTKQQDLIWNNTNWILALGVGCLAFFAIHRKSWI